MSWLPLAPVAVMVWARSSRAALALAGAMAVTWTFGALFEYLFLRHTDDVYSTLLFFCFIVPFVVAPMGAALATVLLGRPRHFFPAVGAAVLGAIVGVICFLKMHTGAALRLLDCFLDMATPITLAISAAVLVGTLAQRRT